MIPGEPELGTGADSQLRVGVRQVALDGVGGDEEGAGDLLVRAAGGREFGGAPLGGGQLAGPAGAPGADAAGLGAGARGPSGGADLVEGRGRQFERAPRGFSAVSRRAARA